MELPPFVSPCLEVGNLLIIGDLRLRLPPPLVVPVAGASDGFVELLFSVIVT